MADRHPIIDYSSQASEHYDADVWVFYGDIAYDTSKYITDIYTNKNRENVIFVLGTYGGVPDGAYKMAKALHHCYKHVTIAIDGPCKSSGTLMAVVANKIVMSELAELGPLDIQLKKKDEFGEMGSGLIAFQALSTLENAARDLLKSVFIDLRTGAQLSTRQALDVATKVSVGALQPIYSQIEPLRLGEQARGMSIGTQYAKRLSGLGKNMKSGAIDRLLTAYPSHGFVIDRDEAGELFDLVERPCDMLHRLFLAIRENAAISGSLYGGENPFWLKLSDLPPPEDTEEVDNEGTDENQDAEPASAGVAAETAAGDGADPEADIPDDVKHAE